MKMKTSLFLTLLLITTGASVIKADEVQLPVIPSPSQLNEGIQRGLTEAQIAELLPWAKDSKVFLADLLENVEELSTTDKVERLIDGIKKSVLESAPKNSELLMRYTLNRALAVSSILTNEMDPNAVGSVDAQSRVLILSIKLALKYYEADMDSLNKKAKTPFVSYGMTYFEFLNDLNKSIFDASAQCAIQRVALEWLQWDLYRDLNNTSYSSSIVKINNALKSFPSGKLSDAQSLSYLKQVKKVGKGLDREKMKQSNVDQATTSTSVNSFDSLISQEKIKKNKPAYSNTLLARNGNFGTFYVAAYDANLCFPIDKAGNRIGSDTESVSISICRHHFDVFFNTTLNANKCYASDSQGNSIGLMTDYVPNSICSNSFRSFQLQDGTYACFATSAKGARIGGDNEKVNSETCRSGFMVFFSPKHNANLCFSKDKDGHPLGSFDESVTRSLCQD